MFRIVSHIRQLPFPKGIYNRTFRYASPRLVVQSNPEIYEGYNPNRTLEEVDLYATTSPRRPEKPNDYQLYGHRDFNFKEHFLSSSPSLHEIKEGGYMSVSDEDMKTYLPDSMGNVGEEFEYSDTKAWMIRDSTKLLCRILEEYEKNKTAVIPPSTEEDVNRVPQGVSLRSQLHGLTDRPERTDALLKVYRRGTQISDDIRPAIGNFDIMCGQGSLVENVLDEVRKGDLLNPNYTKGELPTQIMVTGKRSSQGGAVVGMYLQIHCIAVYWIALHLCM
jgi:hypothetical protein